MPATREVVLEMLQAGTDTIQEIHEVARWPRKNIEAAARQLNLVIDPTTDKARPRGGARPAEPRPTTPLANPTAPPRPQVQPTPAAAAVDCVHVELVAWAAKATRAGIRAKGQRFAELMAELITARRESAEADAAREQRAQERRQALADVERLKTELKTAQDRAREARVGRRPAKDESAISTKEIRAWARENGHVVRHSGRIPEDVVAAYDAAHR